MISYSLFLCVPLVLAQVPVYLRTPALPGTVLAAAPVAQLQCPQQCLPSCLPSCLVAQSPSAIYQPYAPAVAGATPYQIVQSVSQPVVVPAPVVASGYQPYGPAYAPYGPAYIPVIPSCLSQCMPTCAPTCVEQASTPKPQRDDLPTPPPETVPTPAPEIPTTPSQPIDVVPCKCLIKITITQGNKVVSKCGPNSCSCPKNYTQCGSNCCKA
ncbi:hypothetical protein L5515_017589 [Caenorhabditis briggsae]|uniref:Uncharacterized protein n=1 Tax=Caenorhabditis briggsae TaxID=6238 RepID=A0AAE9FGZ1_CAEBR|nr:hypothetical protein L5515_017589 [Caenorhabditis briggsae]